MPKPRFSTGLELVLNGCENDLQIVLTDDERLVCAQSWDMASRGTEILAPALRQIFALAGHSFADLRRIGVFTGPGSFTGIRLCIATAEALMRTTRAQLGALDYLRALATTVSMDHQLLYGRKILVFTHARRNLVHARCHMSYGPVIPSYEVETTRLATTDEAVQQVLAVAAGETQPIFVCGSALQRNRELFERLEAASKDGTIPVLERTTAPSLKALMLFGRHGDYFRKDLEPVYIRPCDAVDNLPGIAERMGMDAKASLERLQALLEQAPKSEI